MYDDSNDPTGYYRRQAKKRDEYFEAAFYPFMKWGTVLLSLGFVVSYAFS